MKWTQYFIGSGNKWEIYGNRETGEYDYTKGEYVSEPYPPQRPSVKNSIPYKILERILKSVGDQSDFHVYLILPMFPEGNPADASIQGQRDLQWRTVEMIVRGVQKEIERIRLTGKSWRNYLTIGFLANWQRIDSIDTNENRMERVNNNKRYMIYVHSKMMIVDDRYIIIGSANLNERSLAGDRDTEICVGLWPDVGYEQIGVSQIRNFRYALWKEHFVEPDENGNYPEEAYWANPENYEECAKKIQQLGDTNYKLLCNGLTEMNNDGINEKKSGHFCSWDIDGAVNGLGLRGNEDHIILDGAKSCIIGDDWYIWPTSYTDLGELIE